MRFARLGDPGGELQWAVLQRGLCSLTRRERLRRLRFARLGKAETGALRATGGVCFAAEYAPRILGKLRGLRFARLAVCVPGGSMIRGTPVGSVYVAFEWDGRPEYAASLGVV